MELVVDYIENKISVTDYRNLLKDGLTRDILNSIPQTKVENVKYELKPVRIQKKTIPNTIYGNKDELNIVKDFIEKDKIKYDLNSMNFNCMDEGYISFDEFVMTDDFSNKTRCRNMRFAEWKEFVDNEEIIFIKKK